MTSRTDHEKGTPMATSTIQLNAHHRIGGDVRMTADSVIATLTEETGGASAQVVVSGPARTVLEIVEAWAEDVRAVVRGGVYPAPRVTRDDMGALGARVALDGYTPAEAEAMSS